MVCLVAGVTDRVGGWCDGVVASGGVWRGGGGEERDGDDGVADGGRREEVVVDVGGEVGGGEGERVDREVPCNLSM